jgi:hypothetical protein
MAIDQLPGPVVSLLNVIGVPWPYIDEEDVYAFGGVVRRFGQAVQTTHDDATKAVGDIAQAHQGASTRAMQSGWSKLSQRHVSEITVGCEVLAAALDAYAGEIVVQKGEAIVTLIGLAEAFIADQAASVETLGLAEAALPAIYGAVRICVKTLADQLQQYVVGKVIEAAAKPLFAKIEQALQGLDWGKGGDSGSPEGATDDLRLEMDKLSAATATLSGHAETVAEHKRNMQSGLAGLNF